MRLRRKRRNMSLMEEHPVPAWYDLDGKLALVQLRQPYVVVTHPADPVIRTDAGAVPMSRVRPEHGVHGAITVPYLRGRLRVVPGEPGRVMVVVSVEMDDGVQADVWLDRDEIVSITVTEQRLVKVPS